MCSVKHRENGVVYQSGRMSLIQEDIKAIQTCCQLSVLLFGKICFNECKAEFPAWPRMTPNSPTCHLPLGDTQTEVPDINTMGIWIFLHGRIAINRLGYKFPIGLTLSNFTFLRSFLTKASSKLKNPPPGVPADFLARAILYLELDWTSVLFILDSFCSLWGTYFSLKLMA